MVHGWSSFVLLPYSSYSPKDISHSSSHTLTLTLYLTLRFIKWYWRSPFAHIPALSLSLNTYIQLSYTIIFRLISYRISHFFSGCIHLLTTQWHVLITWKDVYSCLHTDVNIRELITEYKETKRQMDGRHQQHLTVIQARFNHNTWQLNLRWSIPPPTTPHGEVELAHHTWKLNLRWSIPTNRHGEVWTTAILR